MGNWQVNTHIIGGGTTFRRAKQIFNPSPKNAKSGAILQTLILDSWKSKFHVITPDCMVPTVHVNLKMSRPTEMARGRDTGKDKDKYMDVHLSLIHIWRCRRRG